MLLANYLEKKQAWKMSVAGAILIQVHDFREREVGKESVEKNISS